MSGNYGSSQNSYSASNSAMSDPSAPVPLHRTQNNSNLHPVPNQPTPPNNGPAYPSSAVGAPPANPDAPTYQQLQPPAYPVSGRAQAPQLAYPNSTVGAIPGADNGPAPAYGGQTPAYPDSSVMSNLSSASGQASLPLRRSDPQTNLHSGRAQAPPLAYPASVAGAPPAAPVSPVASGSGNSVNSALSNSGQAPIPIHRSSPRSNLFSAATQTPGDAPSAVVGAIPIVPGFPPPPGNQGGNNMAFPPPPNNPSNQPRRDPPPGTPDDYPRK